MVERFSSRKHIFFMNSLSWLTPSYLHLPFDSQKWYFANTVTAITVAGTAPALLYMWRTGFPNSFANVCIICIFYNLFET